MIAAERKEKEVTFVHKMISHFHTQFWKKNTETFYDHVRKDLFNVSLSSIRTNSRLNHSDMEDLMLLQQSKLLNQQHSSEIKKEDSAVASSNFAKEKQVDASSKVKENISKIAEKDEPTSNPYMPEEILFKKSNIKAPVKPQLAKSEVKKVKLEEPIKIPIARPIQKIVQVVVAPVAQVKKKVQSQSQQQQQVVEDVGSSSFYDMMQKENNEKSRVEDEGLLEKLDDKSIEKEKIGQKVEEVEQMRQEGKEEKYLQEVQPVVVQNDKEIVIPAEIPQNMQQKDEEQVQELKQISPQPSFTLNNSEKVEIIEEKGQPELPQQHSIQPQTQNQHQSLIIIEESVSNVPQPSQENNLTVMSKSEQQLQASYSPSHSKQQESKELIKAQNSLTNMNTTDQGVFTMVVDDPIDIVEKEIDSLVAEYMSWIAQTGSQCQSCIRTVQMRKQYESQCQNLQKKVDELVKSKAQSQSTNREIINIKDDKIRKLQHEIEELQRDLQSESLQQQKEHKITRQRSEHCLHASKDRQNQAQVAVPTKASIEKIAKDEEEEVEESEKNSSDYEEQKESSSSSESEDEKA